MTQKNLQTQQQTQTQGQMQVQQMLPQQVLLVRLTEMPVEALQQRVELECLENPWLEVSTSPDHPEGGENAAEDNGQLSMANSQSESSEALYDYRSEEDMPDFLTGTSHSNNAAEYMADEAELYQGFTTNAEELEHVLSILQQFDPPGIGARSLQECLLLQVRRDETNPYRELLLKLLSVCFDDFIHKRWERICKRLRIAQPVAEQLQKEILRLTPRPGGSVGAKNADRTQAIQPDFLADTDDDEYTRKQFDAFMKEIDELKKLNLPAGVDIAIKV